MPTRGNNGNHGKKGRSGRKSKAAELGLQKLLEDCWTDAQRKTCLKKLATDANSADFKIRHASRELLFNYAFGKPKERHDINQDSFDYNNADLSELNAYELNRLTAGDDPRSVFTASRARRIREEAETARKAESGG